MTDLAIKKYRYLEGILGKQTKHEEIGKCQKVNEETSVEKSIFKR